MQPALLIDEILRNIFQYCLDEFPGTLAALARSCRAWSEPALDSLWSHLSSIAPLLQLIPGVSLHDGIYKFHHSTDFPDLTHFRFYACRVKYINYRHSVKVHPDIPPFFMSHNRTSLCHLLSSLRSVRISAPACDRMELLLGLSHVLRRVTLDLSFKSKTPKISEGRISRYLTDALRVAPGLRHLSVRGALTPEGMDIISSMKNLSTLSLRSGSSMPLNTLVAIAGFQQLVELKLHAAHLNADDLSHALPIQSPANLPSLKKLHIRAQSRFLELFLDILSMESLHTLHIEAHEPTKTPISWDRIFTSISSTAANTLRNLIIERHVELEALDDSVASHIQRSKATVQIPFSDFRILGKLPHLQRLILDTTLPLDICDAELETLVTSWPELEHLDLGLLPTPCHVALQARPPMTSRSLEIIASKAPKLTTVIFTADLSDIAHSTKTPDSISQHALSRMTLGCPSVPDQDVVAPYLHNLYPSLLKIDGLPEHTKLWADVQAALEKLTPHESKYTVLRGLTWQ